MSENSLPITPEMAAILANAPDFARARAFKLAMIGLERAETLMEEGSPAVQLQIVKSVIPVLLKSLTMAQGDSELAELRDEMRKMREEMLELGVGETQGETVEAEVVEDSASDAPIPGTVVPFIPSDSPR